MVIKIESANIDSDGKNIIVGSTEIGSLMGNWISKEPPVVGVQYAAELILPSLKRENVEVFKSTVTQASVFVDTDGFTHFCGECEQIEEDDCCTIRFVDGWLDLVEITPPDFAVGDFVKYVISCNRIDIYPYDTFK